LRIVLDSNILVRANPLVLPRGLARDLLLIIAAGPEVLVLSTAVLDEVRRVLSYPNVQARWSLGEDAIDRYLSFLESAGTVVNLQAVVPAVVSNPDDDPILQTAITVKRMFFVLAIKPFSTWRFGECAPRITSEFLTTSA
jgi:predicted nucleic acid-binding protein